LLAVAIINDGLLQIAIEDGFSGLQVGEIAGVVRHRVRPRLQHQARISFVECEQAQLDAAVQDALAHERMLAERNRGAAQVLDIVRRQYGLAGALLLCLPFAVLFQVEVKRLAADLSRRQRVQLRKARLGDGQQVQGRAPAKSLRLRPLDTVRIERRLREEARRVRLAVIARHR
jgi:hypothetical protein